MKRKQTSERESAPNVHRAVVRPSGGRPSRAEQRLTSILDAATQFYGTWNVSSGQVLLNDKCLAALGYTPAGSPHRQDPLKSLIHVDDRSRFESSLESHLSGRAPAVECEFRLRRNDGSFRWHKFVGKIVQRHRTSSPVQLAAIALDIHESRQQQEEKDSICEQLLATFHAAEDCISVVEPVEFRLITFNKAIEDLLFKVRGLRVKAGMRPQDIDPEQADGWNAMYREILAQGRVSRDFRIESLNVTHHVFGQTLVHDGQVRGICLFGHDVTAYKQMEAALRRSEEKFAKAFRESPLALSLMSLEGYRYIEVNDAFVEASGYSRDEIVGKTAFETDLWPEPDKRMELLREVQLSGEVRNAELLYRTRSGEIREAIGSAVLIDIDGERWVLEVSMDVTERKRAAEALRASEEHLRIAVDAGHMYTFEWDLASDVVQRSKQGISMLGLADDGTQHTKQELIEQMHADDRQNYIRVIESLSPDAPDYRTVFRVTFRNGHMVWLEESGRGIFGPEGKLRRVIGITSDVTEVRQSERALRELSRRLITSQEEERRRIARELHDHIGQEAALICVQAQRVDSGVADEEHTARSDVHELYKRIKGLSSDVSKLSHRLHSSELSFLGLAVAAERLCRDFAGQYGIDVDYQPKGLPRDLDAAKSLCFYRVLQEALQNVVKHSRASRVVVELNVSNNELHLAVTDNGSGFNLEKTGFESGLGLLSMRERLNLVGGRFSISSRCGAGTKVTASVGL